jgi:hypothetical protein
MATMAEPRGELQEYTIDDIDNTGRVITPNLFSGKLPLYRCWYHPVPKQTGSITTQYDYAAAGITGIKLNIDRAHGGPQGGC